MNNPRKPANEMTSMDLYERYVHLFAFERYTMTGLAALSCLTLIGTGAYLLKSGALDRNLFLAIFGSTGAIAYSMGRLMCMFNIGLKIVFGMRAG